MNPVVHGAPPRKRGLEPTCLRSGLSPAGSCRGGAGVAGIDTEPDTEGRLGQHLWPLLRPSSRLLYSSSLAVWSPEKALAAAGGGGKQEPKAEFTERLN